jgi:hypothetical protein
MSYSILPCTIDDVDAMTTCGEEAFANDAMVTAVFNPRNATAEQIKAHHEYRNAIGRKRIVGPGKYYFKAVDEGTGSLVGFVGLFDPQIDVGSQSQIDVERPGGFNQEFESKFRSALRAAEAKAIGDRKDVWCKKAKSLEIQSGADLFARRAIHGGSSSSSGTGYRQASIKQSNARSRPS